MQTQPAHLDSVFVKHFPKGRFQKGKKKQKNTATPLHFNIRVWAIIHRKPWQPLHALTLLASAFCFTRGSTLAPLLCRRCSGTDEAAKTPTLFKRTEIIYFLAAVVFIQCLFCSSVLCTMFSPSTHPNGYWPETKGAEHTDTLGAFFFLLRAYIQWWCLLMEVNLVVPCYSISCQS